MQIIQGTTAFLIY